MRLLARVLGVLLIVGADKSLSPPHTCVCAQVLLYNSWAVARLGHAPCPAWRQAFEQRAVQLIMQAAGEGAGLPTPAGMEQPQQGTRAQQRQEQQQHQQHQQQQQEQEQQHQEQQHQEQQQQRHRWEGEGHQGQALLSAARRQAHALRCGRREALLLGRALHELKFPLSPQLVAALGRVRQQRLADVAQVRQQ